MANTSPREKAEARELGRLRSTNARLRVEAERYQKLRRSVRQKPVERAPVIAQPFEIIDPRSKPQIGTKVLQELTPPLRLGRQMAAAIVDELRAMTLETRALVKALSRGLSQAMDAPDTISGPDSAQRHLETLQERWRQRFNALAEEWSRRMIGGVVSQSSAQLNIGLKDMAERMAIQSTLASPRMRAIVESASLASTNLITRIPDKYLGDVRVHVMSAITAGAGLSELVPYLTKRYKGDARHAQLTALDQIRKVSESVNATRLQSLGVEEYVWIHTGGERYPRKLHQSYHGRTFRYDDPPIIDEKTGVRGHTGVAIGCRCRQRAVLNFMKMVAA